MKNQSKLLTFKPLSSFLMIVALFVMAISVVNISPTQVNAKTVANSFIIPKTVYVSSDNSGYPLKNNGADSSVPINNKNTFTEVSISTNGGMITQAEHNGLIAYGVTGSSVSVNMKIVIDSSLGGNSWYLSSDTYGGTAGQNVMGISTPGKILSGMLIIRKSFDGVNYTRLDSSEYANGLFTTDYANNYTRNVSTPIYTPRGQDVQKGVYLEVDYLYEICHHTKEKKKKKFLGITYDTYYVDKYDYFNIVEQNKFYLSANDPSAVTFHNLSIDKETFIGENGESLDHLVYAETLTDNSVTTKGFKIDTSHLPTANVEVKKNGQAYEIPSDGEIKDDGCFDVTVTTIFGDSKTTRIYVDTRDLTETIKYYFGSSLITDDSKRIFSTGDYPVYEAGKSKYSLKEIDNAYLPLFGTITNLTTGTVIEIEKTPNKKVGELLEAGQYEAVFYNSNTQSGDCTSIVFRFALIEEGSAPGPVINYNSLLDYCKSNVSDLQPFFYSVSQRSAGRGDIIVAFSSYEKAYDYAYSQNLSLVEETSDGCYRYFGPFITQTKEKYYNGFDLTDAINYFTQQSVSLNYFDLSDEDAFSYTTLEDYLLDGRNLRTLELSRSVVVFASEEERTALLQNAELPLIGFKKKAVLDNGIDQKPQTAVSDFCFVRDDLGIDSYSVSLIDSNGKSYRISYGIGFAEQLKAYNLPTGKYLVLESTIYGDTNSYYIRYIAPEDNTSIVSINYSKDGETFDRQITRDSAEDVVIECNQFSLSISDYLDTYSYVKVIREGAFEDGFSNASLDGLLFNEEGLYHITAVNSLGYTFSFDVNVKALATLTINFEGKEFEGIKTFYSATNVSLPTPSKYGYNFVGYVDAQGNEFGTKIQKVLWERDVILKPVWKAKKFSLTLNYQDGTSSTQEVLFDQELILPSLENTQNHAFIGWITESGKNVSSTFTLTEEVDVKLFASYLKVYSTISFDTGLNVESTQYAVGDCFELPVLGREGYVFKGWLLNDKAYAEQDYTVTQTDVLFKAVWAKEVSTIEENPVIETPTLSNNKLQEPENLSSIHISGGETKLTTQPNTSLNTFTILLIVGGIVLSILSVLSTTLVIILLKRGK